MPYSPPDNRYWATSPPAPDGPYVSAKPRPQLNPLSDNDKIRLREIEETLLATLLELVNQNKVQWDDGNRIIAELRRIINPPVPTPIFDNFDTSNHTLITTINSKKEK